MNSPKAVAKVESMPPLIHWPDRSQPFDYAKSEVMQWLTSQPEVHHWLFTKLKERGLIVFDKESGKWMGRKVRT